MRKFVPSALQMLLIIGLCASSDAEAQFVPTMVVTTELDSGDDATIGADLDADRADGAGLSLREALNWAAAGEVIGFDLDGGTPGAQGGTIVSSAQFQIIVPLTLTGDVDQDGDPDVVLSGNNANRVLVVNSSLSPVIIDGLELTQGVTGGGGGGLFLGSSSNTTLQNCRVTDNVDTGGGGGGIFGSATTLTMRNCLVRGNTSPSFGGGVRLVGGGSAFMTASNVTLQANTTTGSASHGGGLQFGGNTLRLTNATITGNSVLGAGAFGGGVRVTSGTSFIYDSTIVGNASNSTGGGIHANGTDTFINVVVAGNTSGAGATAAAGGGVLASGGSSDDVGGTIEVSTNSYFGSAVAITTGTASLQNQGTANLGLAPLAANGGVGPTHSVLPGSALLNAGSTAALPTDFADVDGDGDTAEVLPLDGRYSTRVVGSEVDIGAVEGNGGVIVSVSSATPDGLYSTGDAIDVTVTFSSAMTVTGSPRVLLETGTVDRFATYTGGSGTTGLNFQYVISAGDSSPDLDTVSASSFDLNGGTVGNANGPADIRLPEPGTAGSLGAGHALVVDAVAPGITSVAVPADGTYVAGQTLDFSVQFDEAVTVTGTPQLSVQLDAGGPGTASYLSGSGSNTLLFRYAVSAGEADPTGIALGPNVVLNGGTLRDAADNDAVLALAGVAPLSGVLIDAVAPAVDSVAVPANGTYVAGQTLDFSVQFDEAVTVTGTPQLTVQLDLGGPAAANYVSGSGSTTLLFRYVVSAGQADPSGIALAPNVVLNGGSVRDVAGNDASLTLAGVAPLSGVLVDADAASVVSVAVPADGTYVAGQTLEFTVAFDESVTVTGTPQLTVQLDVGGPATASYVSGSGSAALLFRYMVSAGQADPTGIALGPNVVLNGGTVRDLAANDASLALAGVAPLSGVLVDADAPAILSVAVPADGTYGAGQALDFTVAFDESVTVTGTPQLSVQLDTGGPATASYVSGSGSAALLFRYVVSAGQADPTGIALGPNVVLNGGSVRDAASNDAVLTLVGVGPLAGVLVDADAAAVVSVTVPAGGTYIAGEALDFTVTFDEPVTVTGTPQLTVQLDVGGPAPASYVSGSGSAALLFRYVVAVGQADPTGIALAPSAVLNGGSVRDAASNDASVVLANVGALGGVLIDGVAPTVTSIARIDPSPVSTSVARFLVTFSESVVGVDLADFAISVSGSVTGTITAVTGGPAAYTVTVSGITGSGSLRLDLAATGTGISDPAGNAVAGGFSGGETYAVALGNVAAPTVIPSGSTISWLILSLLALLTGAAAMTKRR